MKKHPLLILAVASLLRLGAHAHGPAVAAEMSRAATQFLGSLNDEQKAKASFGFSDDERKNWHFIPRERRGLPLKEMTPAQRDLVTKLLKTGLSNRGHEKVETIVSLESLLREMEKGRQGGPVRDPERYFVSIFGKPGTKEPWAWRYEGHHLSLNFTNGNGEVLSVTPSFLGTNPGEVRDGERKGLRVLAQEEELGRTLVKSLDEAQRKTAILPGDAPKEIINMPGRSDWTKPEGIAWVKLTEAQREGLTKLIREYLDRYRPEIAKEDWAAIEKSGVEKIHFVWAGGLERGEPHYYRVQGETFILEYDNTQGNANHVHCVWRDRLNDFADDPLKRHIEDAHQPAKK